MQIINPFQMNDWPIKKIIITVLSSQLALWGVIGLDYIGFQIPIIRPLVVIVNLIFIPGILVLRVLKLHKLSNIETLLYSVGLSIAMTMFIGLLINTIYPLLGISRPFSVPSLMITITCVMLILSILCYKIDPDYSNFNFIDSKDILSTPALFLYLIPFLAVFGTYLVNSDQNNILLMLMIISVVSVVFLIGFDRFIQKNMYPLAVFVVAISLLLHNSLISEYITGWDIHFEYFLSNLVISNSVWNSSIPSSVNAMLSIVMFSSIFSVLSNISLVWVFKIIYPLLFSLVPVGLYKIYKEQTNDKIAFISVFFFMSLFVFYTEMLALARQQIAELFLVLIILLIINDSMDKMRKTILLLIFTFSLVVSHYGISYIFMASLIAVWFILYIIAEYKHENTVSTISTTYVLLYITFILSWYMNISNSSAFNSIIHIVEHIVNSIFTDFMNPNSNQGLELVMKEGVSHLHRMTKYLHLISQFFISVGVITLLLSRKKIRSITERIENEYAAFSVVNFIVLLAGIVIPFFASAINTSRLYHIALIFLAPFFVIGCIIFFKSLYTLIGRVWTDQHVQYLLKTLSVFVGVFLLFNSGFIYEIANDGPTSISLSSIENSLQFNEQEVTGAKWLSAVRNEKLVCADQPGWLLLSGIIGLGNYRINADTKRISSDIYIYLRSKNIRDGKIAVMDGKIIQYYVNLHDSRFYKEVIVERNKIYDNPDVQIYVARNI